MQRPKATLTGALAGLALAGSLLTTAAPANAAGNDAPAASSSSSADRNHHGGLCSRVSKVDQRLARAIKRIDGDEQTRGSLARLEKRLKNARAKKHDEIATFLQDRLATRKARRPALVRQRAELKDVAAWCTKQKDHGQEKKQDNAPENSGS
ncbi:hypothetical protein Sgleb_30660 [Streptomyces glebosus]|uniref:Secreted protein n=1 Tax=Streptomyces glebosus TaxID=249580 RepID=A0A640SU94_9ACTN|nr:hypothetical protein [Streptomyces glebosus]GFE15019.1 hypothetical protein Sgleb_30660 [Streptomyces glebosus]GHG61356.1 hypothetical protein GCM10010513_27460 [Streptomyces glebosus]